jgi:hypothetical protein
MLMILQMFNTNWQKQDDIIGNEMKETDSNVSEYKWLNWLRTIVILEILEMRAHSKKNLNHYLKKDWTFC